MVVSFFRARALSFRVSSGFFFFFTFISVSLTGQVFQVPDDGNCEGTCFAMGA